MILTTAEQARAWLMRERRRRRVAMLLVVATLAVMSVMTHLYREVGPPSPAWWAALPGTVLDRLLSLGSLVVIFLLIESRWPYRPAARLQPGRIVATSPDGLLVETDDGRTGHPVRLPRRGAGPQIGDDIWVADPVIPGERHPVVLATPGPRGHHVLWPTHPATREEPS